MKIPIVIDAAYRALLLAYPGKFRRRHGPAMLQMFRDAYRRAASHGPAAQAAFLARSAGDLAVHALLERLAPVRQRFSGNSLQGMPKDQGRLMFLRSLGTDLHHAWRVFTRAPLATTSLAVATLALGIGANAAMFTVIYNVLISPLPYPAADRVFIGWRWNPQLGDVSVSPAISEVEGWKNSGSVEAVATYANQPMVLTGAGDPEAIDGVRIDARVLAFTGTVPRIGRDFTAADTANETVARVALVSDGMWRTRFGGDPAVIGRTIELDDRKYEIVGVLPGTFKLPMTDIDIAVPLAPPPPPAKGQRPGRTSVSALVRLKPGISATAATDELTALGTSAVAGTSTGWRVKLMPPADLSGASFQRTLFILFGAVGCVLLIACANVAHLVLARNTARRREMGVRVAIGASTGRLARQLFLENLLLALVGAAVGLALGLWGVQAISAIRPPHMRQLADMRLATPVFAFGFLLALVTGVAFGLLPSIASARRPAADALKHGGASLGSPRAAGVRRALTVAEIALALVLLTGAGLLLRSYARVLSTDRGFRPDSLVSVKLDLPQSRYPSPASLSDFTRRASEAVAAVPGVKRVIIASAIPPAGGLIFASELMIEGHESPVKGTSMFGGGFVQPGFFEALRIPLRAGRTFRDADLQANSVIVNERTAAMFWPGRSAIGQRLRLGKEDDWNTVVGVVGDVQAEHGEAGGMQLYFPMANAGMWPDPTLLVATDTDPAALIPSIRAGLRSLDGKLPLEEIETVEQSVQKVTARPRFNVLLLSVFAGIGLLLAVIGVYGVVSYSVSLRTREIALRMALGAAPQSVGFSILKEALALAAAGTLMGLLAAVGAAQLLKKLLFEVSPNDPVTLAGVALTLAATAVVAAWLPARRAMRVDPIVALRND